MYWLFRLIQGLELVEPAGMKLCVEYYDPQCGLVAALGTRRYWFHYTS
jgi:hypothetical protein